MSDDEQAKIKERFCVDFASVIQRVVDLGYQVTLEGKPLEQVVIHFDQDKKVIDISNSVILEIAGKQKTEFDECMEICRTKTIREWLELSIEHFRQEDRDYLHASIFVQRKQDIHKSLEEIFTGFLSDMTTNEKYIGCNATDKYASYMKIMEDLLTHQLEIGNKFHFQIHGPSGCSFKLSRDRNHVTYSCDKFTPLGYPEHENRYPTPEEAVSYFITQCLNLVQNAA